MTRLFIAEKPNMASEIAANLPGPMKRADGYIETGDGIVTWLFGHILRQADPDEYDERYKTWRLADLPIIPAEWKLIIAESCRKQFRVIKGLVEKTDVIIHAGDPDREGQLLVDEVLDYLDNKKPVKRVLLNALDEKSIKTALADLRNNQDFYNLKQSALARSRADWLVGMNLSRAYTLAAKKNGYDHVFPVGRVKTPTLALVVRREREIAAFKPINHFGIKATYQHKNGTFTATWKPKEDQAGLDAEGRLIDKEKAVLLKTIMETAAATEKATIISYETVKKNEPQRLPFSLSELQIVAGKKFGYDPQTVLDTAQHLYEKKLTTYPRSDCDFLPESQFADSGTIIDNLKTCGQADLSAWAAKADTSIKSRAWNDKKVSAHHAIIPTSVVCPFDKLTATEQNIYYLISQAYIAQFYAIHSFNQTSIEVSYIGEIFKANGRVTLVDGWKDLFAKNNEQQEDEEENATLPAMKKGDPADYKSAAITTTTTKPPQRYTSSTLVEAMKQIHKYVQDDSLKKRLKDVSGIGTEATRATIIKELLDREFLKTVKKHLQPTEAAYVLIDALPDKLTYPDSTALWEQSFNDMLTGNEKLENFLRQQTDFITELCGISPSIKLNSIVKIDCPKCGKGHLRLKKSDKGKFWGCSTYPECKATFDDAKGKPDMSAKEKAMVKCPNCNDGNLRLIKGPKGDFWGCTRYPDCKTTFNDKKGKPELTKKAQNEVKCPTCNDGILKLKNGSKGSFWGCSAYPSCKASFSDKKGQPVISQ